MKRVNASRNSRHSLVINDDDDNDYRVWFINIFIIIYFCLFAD